MDENHKQEEIDVKLERKKKKKTETNVSGTTASDILAGRKLRLETLFFPF